MVSEESKLNRDDEPYLKWDVYSQELMDNNALSDTSYNDLKNIGMKKEWVDDFLEFQREKLFECVLQECSKKQNISCGAEDIFKHVVNHLDNSQKEQLIDDLNSFRKDKMEQGVNLLLKLYSNTSNQRSDNATADPPVHSEQYAQEQAVQEKAAAQEQAPSDNDNLGYRLLYQSKSENLPKLSEEEIIRKMANPLYRRDSNYRKQLHSLLARTRYFID